MGKEKVSYIGRRFGRLVVLERAEDAITPKGQAMIRYKCKCDCGNEKTINKCHLASGKIISCGCFHKEQLGNMRRKHGKSAYNRERLYTIWLNMKHRCYNHKNNHYKNYGGRGITICKEWLDDYMSFRDWSYSHGYEEKIEESGRNSLTIDRINNGGNYEPSNCRWVTNKENCLNKQNTMSDEERYNICPVCGKHFTQTKRNGQQTCSAKCGQVIRKSKISTERNKDGTFKKTKS